MPLKYKLTEDGKAVQLNNRGLPIAIDEEKGEELGLDAIHLYGRVPQLTQQAKDLKTHNEKLSPVMDRLKGAGVKALDDGTLELDPWLDDVTKALTTMKNLKDKQLIDAGEVEAIKRQATEALSQKVAQMETAHNEKVKELSETLKARDGKIYDLMVAEKFNSSKFVKERLQSMTPKMARKYWGENFTVEQDDAGNFVVVGRFADGEKIYSREQAGQLADIDEALSILVERDPDRDKLLAGTASSGSGAQSIMRDGRVIKNPFKKGPDWNLTEQALLARSDPQLAKMLQAQAT